MRGGNYGWDIREGAHCFERRHELRLGGPDRSGRRVRPQPSGFSITGGYVYRGTQTTELVGRYVFGDFGTA